MAALRAMTDEASGARTEGRARWRARAKHHFLRTNANALPVTQDVHAVQRVAPYLHPIARPEVFDRGPLSSDANPRMLTRNQRVFDRHLASSTTTNDRIALRQIDLLKQETETESCQWHSRGGVENGILRVTRPGRRRQSRAHRERALAAFLPVLTRGSGKGIKARLRARQRRWSARPPAGERFRAESGQALNVFIKSASAATASSGTAL